jgi:hypothetical protein
MTDREVQAISQFLLRFGHLGCYQITVLPPQRGGAVEGPDRASGARHPGSLET